MAPMLNFYGFVPVALGGLGNNRGADHRRTGARPVPAGRELPGRRHLRLRRRVRRVHHRAAAAARRACSARRTPRRVAYDGVQPPIQRVTRHGAVRPARRRWFFAWSLLGIRSGAARCRFVGNEFWVVIGTRAAIYWVLVGGAQPGRRLRRPARHRLRRAADARRLHAAVLVGRQRGAAWSPLLALSDRGRCVGAIFGVIVGLPALRLRTFYFAMTTLGFATIVTQIALAWQSVTGGGIGLPGPELPAPFNTTLGLLLSSASRSRRSAPG